MTNDEFQMTKEARNTNHEESITESKLGDRFMQAHARLSSTEDVLPLRTRYREEMNCQIVHDSIHRREGWTLSYLLDRGGIPIGFGSVAIGGPWKGKPTVFEFYVLPQYRSRAFDIFDALLLASGARFFE